MRPSDTDIEDFSGDEPEEGKIKLVLEVGDWSLF
jgi:hypothetical protein